jgi:hypothetical protein
VRTVYKTGSILVSYSSACFEDRFVFLISWSWSGIPLLYMKVGPAPDLVSSSYVFLKLLVLFPSVYNELSMLVVFRVYLGDLKNESEVCFKQQVKSSSSQT